MNGERSLSYNTERDLASYRQLPTPKQLFRIVSIGMGLAKNQGSIRGSKIAENAYIFLPNWLEQEELGGDTYRATVHKYVGRVARTGYRKWGLRLREGVYLVEGNESIPILTLSGEEAEINLTTAQSGYTNTYTFNWTDKRVLDAQKKIHKFEQQGTIFDYMGGWADFREITNKLEVVSKADCEALIEHMQNFSRASHIA